MITKAGFIDCGCVCQCACHNPNGPAVMHFIPCCHKSPPEKPRPHGIYTGCKVRDEKKIAPP